MSGACDILVSGTGSFAARIVFDLAAAARTPVRVVIAGRNADRLNWLTVAANARASIFGSPARFDSHQIDLLQADAASALVEATRPRVLVQAASIQGSSVIADSGSAWARLVADGGLSATAVLQAIVTKRVAEAISATSPDSILINCCLPDVVNGLVAALGLNVACGVGNVAILANVFQGSAAAPMGRLKVLAHYQNLADWRLPAADRTGRPPRVWSGTDEIGDVFGVFGGVRLTPEPVIDISGASGVPLALAFAAAGEWSGHVPGPNGLPGGYPVRLSGGRLALDLPAAVGERDAVAWNRSFEDANGLVIEAGRARYTGKLFEALRRHSPDLARGFAIGDLEATGREMVAMRARLTGRQ